MKTAGLCKTIPAGLPFVAAAALAAGTLFLTSLAGCAGEPQEEEAGLARLAITNALELASGGAATSAQWGQAFTKIPVGEESLFDYEYWFKPTNGDAPIGPVQPVSGGDTFTLTAGGYVARVKAFIKDSGASTETYDGEDSRHEVAFGDSEPFTVAIDKETIVNVTLTPYLSFTTAYSEGGAGTFSYEVWRPAGTTITELSLTSITSGKVENYTNVPDKGGGSSMIWRSASNTVPVGFYTFLCLLMNETDGTSAGVMEVVHIYNGIETSVEYNFTLADFVDTGGDIGSGYNIFLGLVHGEDPANVVEKRSFPTGVIAKPAPGYTFLGWYDKENLAEASLVSTNASYTFDLIRDVSLYALFNGNGADTPKNITSLAELKAIDDSAASLTSKYRLMVDISGMDEPIGSAGKQFTGAFNGNGYNVDVYINGLYDPEYAGLFGYVGRGGSIEKVSVTGVVRASKSAGGVAGYFGGSSITNVWSSVQVAIMTGNDEKCAGGIVGELASGSVIRNAYSSGVAFAGYGTTLIAGGIAGKAAGTIENCAALLELVGGYNGEFLHFGRVYGQDNAGTYRRVYGSDSIMNEQGAFLSGASNPQAENVTDAAARTEAFWTNGANWYNGAWSAEVWNFLAGAYPNFVGIGGGTEDDGGNYTIAAGLVKGEDTANVVETTADKASIIARPAAGYTFVGWYDKEDLAEAILVSTSVLYTAAHLARDTTLYGLFTGDGVSTPRSITNLAELKAIDDSPASLTCKYRLMADISGMDEPIGGPSTQFTGAFNGNGHNVDMNIQSGEYAGLFGYVGRGGSIERVSVTGTVTATGLSTTAGGIAGYFGGASIANVWSGAEVTSMGLSRLDSNELCAGGIVGELASGSVIRNAYASGAVVAGYTGTRIAGGIAGKSAGTLENCVALLERVGCYEEQYTTPQEPVYLGRVYGLDNAGTYTKVYGSDSILNEQGSPLSGASNPQAAVTTDAAARKVTFWTGAANWQGGAWSTEVWTFLVGAYPKLQK